MVCHGDVHPGNVVMTADGPDAPRLGPAVLGATRMGPRPDAHLGDRWGGDGHEYPAFAAGYGRSLADDAAAVAVAELRLVAATLMRLVAGIADPGSDARSATAAAVLAWRTDAPAWTAQ